MEETLPPGFRFHPTDEELIIYYLTNKVSDVSFSARAFADVDLNKCEPWDLPAKASMGKKEWYFFNLRDRKYPTGLRTNRATEAGYWKTTGKDKEIFHGGVLVGMKKTLVFYRGRAPKGQKTNWVMHEYRLETEHGLKPSKEEWVVCRVFQKSSTVKKQQPTSSSPQYSLESPNCDTNYTIANEIGDIHELLNFNGIATPSNGINNNISLQNYVNENMNMNLNLAAATNIVPLLPNLSSSLLSSNLSSVNSLLLRALQSRVYNQPREAATVSDYYSLITPSLQGISHFGNDFTNSNFAEGVASSSMVLDSVQQQQVQEEPCKLDIDIW